MRGNRPDLRWYKMVFSIVLGSLLRTINRLGGFEIERQNEVRAGQEKRWSANRFSSVLDIPLEKPYFTRPQKRKIEQYCSDGSCVFPGTQN